MKTLLLFLFAFGFRITTGKVTVVQTCPRTKTAWEHRSSIFTCEDGNNKYHCVMTSMLNLVEVCITPLNITENEKGCPLVYIRESAGYWEFPLTSCPVQNTECPQDGHGGYTSEQLYKYPSCFRNISERISGDNNFTQTTTGTRVSTSTCNIFQEVRTSNMEYLPYTTVVMFLLLGSLHVFILLVYWTNRRHVKQVEAMIEEWSKRFSQISSSSINTLPGEVMIEDGSKSISQVSSSSSSTLPDLKENDEIPLTVSHRTRTRKTRQNSYVPFHGKTDVKVDDEPPLPVSDARKGTSSTSNYESPVQKDMKGNDLTPLPDTDPTIYEICSVQKDMKGNDLTPLPDIDPTIYEICSVQKDVKVNDDPSLPVSDSRKGTISAANYERPVQKGLKGNDAIPLSDNDPGTRATYYENYPVQKERTEQN